MNRITFLILAASMMPFLGCENQQVSDLPPESKQSVADSEAVIESNVVPAGTDTGDRAEILFGEQFPEVLAAKVTLVDNDRYRFNVTLSSAYDTPERYADAWRVLDKQDNELGIRILTHDHANEQPFTRSGTVQVPGSIRTVFVEGRDQANGWSGQRFEVKMP